jgi:hypothetical protein
MEKSTLTKVLTFRKKFEKSVISHIPYTILIIIIIYVTDT